MKHKINYIVVVLGLVAVTAGAAAVGAAHPRQGERNQDSSPPVPTSSSELQHFQPPYDDEEFQVGDWCRVNTDYTCGWMDGLAMAGAASASCAASGWISPIWEQPFDPPGVVYGRITEIEFQVNLRAGINGDIYWDQGECGFSLEYAVYKNSLLADTGLLFEKQVPASPGASWQTDDPRCLRAPSSVELDFGDTIEIRFIGSVNADRGDSDGSCNVFFDLTLDEITLLGDLPDIVAVDITTVPKRFGPGADVQILALVENHGSYPTCPPDRDWYVRAYFDGDLLGTLPVGRLMPNDFLSVSFPKEWPYDLRFHDVLVKADTGDTIDDDVIESDEDNNDRTEHFRAKLLLPHTTVVPVTPVTPHTQQGPSSDQGTR